MKTPRSLLLSAGLIVAMAASTQADLFTLTATEDTFITEHPSLGGPTSTHEADPSLYSIYGNFGLPGGRSYPLVRFDLSSLAGQTVVGPATFE